MVNGDGRDFFPNAAAGKDRSGVKEDRLIGAERYAMHAAYRHRQRIGMHIHKVVMRPTRRRNRTTATDLPQFVQQRLHIDANDTI